MRSGNYSFATEDASPAPDADDGGVAIDTDVLVEIHRLYRAGFHLLPLGGVTGQKAIAKFRDRDRLPLSTVTNRMETAKSNAFGIRLPGLLVLDIDSDNPETWAYVEKRFSLSNTRTKTGKGWHLWYRHSGQKPVDVDLPGIRIDFKAGPNSYVVGPKSIRADGVTYRPQGKQLVSVSELPLFEVFEQEAERPEPEKVGARYPVGCRHKMLKRRAHQLALVADNFSEMLADLIAFREWEIEKPEDFSDDWIENLGLWYWELRERGKLWQGKDSAVLINRFAIDELARRGEGLAFLLHAILMADHGHKPGATFAIVPDSLRDSGRLKGGRRQIYDAIEVLIDAGLLHCTHKPRGRRNHSLYQLGNGQQAGEKGEGSKIILVSDSDTHSDETMGVAA